MKFRVHQIAKEFGRTTKEVLAVLDKLGVDAKHHTSTVDEEYLHKIKKYLDPYAKTTELPKGLEAKVAKAKTKAKPKKKTTKAAAKKKPAKKVSEKPKRKVTRAPKKRVTKAKEESKVVAVEKTVVKEAPVPEVQETTEVVAVETLVAKEKISPTDPSVQVIKQEERIKEEPAVRISRPRPVVRERRVERPAVPKPREVAPSRPVRPRPSPPPRRPAPPPRQKTPPPPRPQPAPTPPVAAPPPPKEVVVPEGPRETIQISENIAVKDLAQKLSVMSKVILKKLLDRGVLANINQRLDLKVVEQLAADFGFDTEVVTYEEVVAQEQEGEESPASLMTRPPVVTIMGHVDHGKTSLLDAIRETNVVAGESGGITQHIGAYQVTVGDRAITFIDTPGHEAFTRMRARGAQVTDIVILVVAADDGVMPQTVEAIDHAAAARVPIIVAINKMDKPEANPERIKRQLADHSLIIEEYGGDTVCVPISARKRTNIDTLLEMILLVADLLDLKANPDRLATATVLEASLDKTRGSIASVLVQNGTLHVGDVFVAGSVMGRVRAMFDDHGDKMKEITPGSPAEVLGFQGVAQAGDSFQVFKDEFKARSIVAFRQTKAKEMAAQASSRLSLDQLFDKIRQGEIQELPVIIKADVQGSVEVLRDSLLKLGTNEVQIKIIHTGTGAVSSSDVLLASASNAIIIGYNVRPELKARELIDKENVDVRTHTVIYDIVSEIKSALEGLLRPTIKEIFVGSAEVRDTFRIPKVGTVAGCFVVSGKITRNAAIRLVRDDVVIYEGKISSLKRFKDDASEVKENYECGIGLENYNDIKVGDYIEAYNVEKIARQLA